MLKHYFELMQLLVRLPKICFHKFHVLLEFGPIFREKDEAKKKEMAEKFKKEELPPFMKNMAQALKDNGGQWLVGGDITYADIMLAGLLGMLDKRHPGVMEKQAPLLYKHKEKVVGLPKIKEWISKRPKTEF